MKPVALDKCTPEERRLIEFNYKRVILNEITVPAFFEEMYRLLGRDKFFELFPQQASRMFQSRNTPYSGYGSSYGNNYSIGYGPSINLQPNLSSLQKKNHLNYTVGDLSNNLENITHFDVDDIVKEPETLGKAMSKKRDQHAPLKAVKVGRTSNTDMAESPAVNEVSHEEIVPSRTHFPDIIDYAGVNLKEEEHIQQSDSISSDSYPESSCEISHLFDVPSLMHFVELLAKKRGMLVDESVYNALFLSLRRKLKEMIDKMERACRIRVDYLPVLEKEENEKTLREIEAKTHFDKYSMTADPMDTQSETASKKQDQNSEDQTKRSDLNKMYENGVLKQNEKIEKSIDESSAVDHHTRNTNKHGKKQHLTIKIPNNKSAGHTSTCNNGILITSKNNMALTKDILKIENDVKRQLYVLEQVEKNGLARILDLKQETAKKKAIEREDLLVKKRLSNSVAMAALGQRKRWSGELKEQKMKSHFLSLYAPYNEKEMERALVNRKITMDDYIYVMERDKRYNKSIFIIKEYFRKI